MESVAAFAWNGWQPSSGFSGSFGLEYASEQLTYANAPTPAAGYTVVNGRLTFAGDNWSASLWGNNLAEKEYFVLYFDLLEALGSRVGFPGPPRTYGVEFTYNF